MSFAEIQRQHKTMKEDAWVASFHSRPNIRKEMHPTAVHAAPSSNPATPTNSTPLRYVDIIAETPAKEANQVRLVGAPTETGQARLYGRTAGEWAAKAKSYTPEAQLIEQMKQEIDTMEETLHIITPLPKPETKEAKKTASQGCSLLTPIRAIARAVAAIFRFMFCCSCTSPEKVKKTQIKAEKAVKKAHDEQVRNDITDSRAILNDTKKLKAILEEQCVGMSELDALKQVRSNFNAYVLRELNYSIA